MKIIMEYPFISNNELCDGTRHVIVPQEINSFIINGVELYELTYEDETFGQVCGTILRREGSKFYKVPLYSYDDFYERVASGSIKLKPISLSILNNVSSISADKPINSIDSITSQINSRTTTNYSTQTEEKPRKMGVVPLFIDEEGNIYTRGFSAQAIFGVGGSSFYYKLTPEQVRIILENFNVEWFKYSKLGGKFPIKSTKTLAQLLKAFCMKNNCSSNMFKQILDSNIIYVVIQSSEDEQIYRGKFDRKTLLLGLPSFIYEDGIYKRCSSISTPLIYLKELTKNLKEGEYINIEYVEPTYDDFYKYEFVGGYQLYPTVTEELVPQEYDIDVKNTLSSAMLGHIHSKCRNNNGIWVDGFLDYTFDIKEIKEKEKNKRR